jgi:hypothetical protein
MRKTKWTEIGNGEGSSIDWVSNFSVLYQIDDLIMGFEAADIECDCKSIFKSIPGYQTEKKSAAAFKPPSGAIDLIREHPNVSTENQFFDPDMPISSIWTKVFVKKSAMPTLIGFLDLAKEELRKRHAENGIPQLLEMWKKENTEREIEKTKARKKLEREKRKREKIIEEAMVQEYCDNILEKLSAATGYFQHGNFLVDAARQEIFVLVKHRPYRRSWTGTGNDKKLFKMLNERSMVFEIIESKIPESPHIPIRGSILRRKEMGWGQDVSVLHCADPSILKKANKVRQKFIAQKKRPSSKR